jgi:hypothetical protein
VTGRGPVVSVWVEVQNQDAKGSFVASPRQCWFRWSPCPRTRRALSRDRAILPGTPKPGIPEIAATRAWPGRPYPMAREAVFT